MDDRMVRDHLREQRKARPRGARPETKIIYKVMEKKFIKREDLGEILETLAESGMKHPELRVSMDIETWLGEQLLKVRVYDTEFKLRATQDYAIINGMEDDYDVLDQTVEKAVADMERMEAEKKSKEESKDDSNS
jgi:hypothetical protein